MLLPSLQYFLSFFHPVVLSFIIFFFSFCIQFDFCLACKQYLFLFVQVLNKWFESEPLRATLATDSVIGAMTSPLLPGSA